MVTTVGATGDWAGLPRWLVVLLLVLLTGCGTSSSPPASHGAGTRKLTESCERSEDCESSICVRLDQNGGICSTACQSNTGCPLSDNWGCVSASNVDFKVCACRRLADEEVCGDGLDNDCDGRTDDCRICHGEQVSASDHENCGACDYACRGDQECTHGACVCRGESRDCAGRCVDLQSDDQACGACGNACGAGLECVSGVCQCTRATDSACPAAGCVDLKTDPNNCGSCGRSCDFARECVAGACSCAAPGAPDFCDGVGCVDLKSDAANCGDCGTKCPADQSCVQGSCACPNGQSVCDGKCTDVSTSSSDCGECGKACGKAQACIAGKCGCNTGGYSICGEDCVNLTTDAGHCGTCDKACAAGERCSGACVCDSGLYCGGACVPVDDDANCGQCGHACAAGQSCSFGECVCDAFGMSACGASCVDLDTDEAHCGECDGVCLPSELCNGGICDCPSGQKYCAAANSCVNLKTDTSNCGVCGKTCNPGELCSNGVCGCAASGALYCASAGTCVDTLANTQDCGACDKKCNPTEACAAGKCGCSIAGQQYCASHKACTDTLSNTADCGGCDKACNPTEVCANGGCKCSGATEKYCAGSGACVDLTSDSKNCSACDAKCPNLAHCSSSSCVCDKAGLTLCSGVCYDLQKDAKHCGSCSGLCGGSYLCKAGECKCNSPTLGSEVHVVPEAVEQGRISAAFDGTHVGVAYLRASSPTHHDLYFALLNSNGTLVSTQAVTAYAANTTGVMTSPSLVWTGTEYGVAWTEDLAPGGDDDQVMLQRIKPDGSFVVPAVPLAKSYANGNALVWSASYGGYAVAFKRFPNGTDHIGFRRVGVDGTGTDPEIDFLANSDPNFMRLAAAPDGKWMVGTRITQLSLRNANGSAFGALVQLAPTSVLHALIHDGTSWLAAFEQNGSSAVVNRGAVLNSPYTVYPGSQAASHARTELSMVNGTVAVLDSAIPPLGPFNGTLTVQRFALPTDGSSTLRAIDDLTPLSGNQTVALDLNNIALVTTGTTSLLGLWSDGRTSPSQLYAQPIQLPACP